MNYAIIKIMIEQGQNHKFNNKGQAAIEYILVFVIVVGLILAISIKFFTPLQGFINDTMGTYVECLLETGELPALSSDDSNSECNLGSLGVAGQFGGQGKNGPGGKNGSNEKNAEGKDGNNNGSSSSESDSSSGSAGGAYSGYAGSRGGLFGRRSTTRNAESSAKNGKTIEIALNDSSGGGFFKVNNSVGGYGSTRRSRPVITRELSSAQQKQLKDKTRGGATKVIEGETPKQAPKKILVKPPPPPKTFETEDEPISFGNYFRYFLIAAIIIIIILIIGGQAMQLSKSFEK